MKNIDRYVFFMGEQHNPCGGFGDMYDSSNDIGKLEDDGVKAFSVGAVYWWHIVDLTTMKIVREGEI